MDGGDGPPSRQTIRIAIAILVTVIVEKCFVISFDFDFELWQKDNRGEAQSKPTAVHHHTVHDHT